MTWCLYYFVHGHNWLGDLYLCIKLRKWQIMLNQFVLSSQCIDVNDNLNQYKISVQRLVLIHLFKDAYHANR